MVSDSTATGDQLAYPACRPCRHWTYHRFILAGVPSEAPACAKHIVLFPDIGRDCLSFEREPGSDDE